MFREMDTRIAIREPDLEEAGRQQLLQIAANRADREAISGIETYNLNTYMQALNNGLNGLLEAQNLINQRIRIRDDNAFRARHSIVAGGGFGFAGLLIGGPIGAGAGLAFVAMAATLEHNRDMSANQILRDQLAITERLIQSQRQLLGIFREELDRRNRSYVERICCSLGAKSLCALFMIVILILSYLYKQCASDDTCSSHLPRLGR
jgi:hypothetical protein